MISNANTEWGGSTLSGGGEGEFLLRGTRNELRSALRRAKRGLGPPNHTKDNNNNTITTTNDTRFDSTSTIIKFCMIEEASRIESRSQRQVKSQEENRRPKQRTTSPISSPPILFVRVRPRANPIPIQFTYNIKSKRNAHAPPLTTLPYFHSSSSSFTHFMCCTHTHKHFTKHISLLV